MGRNRDKKIARKYQLPVEVLRHVLPQTLREARDDEVRNGRLIRVSSATGLTAALAQEGPGRQPPLEVYLVLYIPLREASMITEMLHEQKKRGKYHADGDAAAAAPRLRRFFIANPQVLEAKYMSFMAPRGELVNLELFAQKVHENPDKFPHELDQFACPEDDIGLKASRRFFQPLKDSYFVACTQSANLKEAKHILKQIHLQLYKSLFRSFSMAKVEEDELIVKVATDYEASLGLNGKTLNGDAIARQLLGLISFADFEDKKKLIIPDTSTFADRKMVLKRLKRQNKKLKELEMIPTLIGAAMPDFREI